MKKNTPSSSKLFERGFYKSLGEGLSMSAVFQTFLEIVIISLVNANPIHDEKREEREKRYKTLISLWKDKTIPSQMLSDLVTLMQEHHEEKRDIIGEMYEDFVCQGENGQFFTPHHIADMMAQVIEVKDTKGGVVDIACGSGKLLMGALKNNPRIKLYGVDIDRRCVMMATINCFFYGGCGDFLVGNSLLNEYEEGWRVSYGFIYELNIEQKQQVVPIAGTIIEEKKSETYEIPIQQSLF